MTILLRYETTLHCRAWPSILILLILCTAGLAAQPVSDSSRQSSDSVHLIPWRAAIVGGGTAGIVTLAHLQNYNAWWKGSHGPFHLGEDGGVYLHLDKLGHFYFTYLAADVVGRSFQWAGMEDAQGLWWGGGIALAFQLYVEVEDGTHPELGFSIGDAIADVAGAAWPLLAQTGPLHPVRPKWSAIPSNAYKAGGHRTLIDDYESQHFWLSVNIADALGAETPCWIPSFLNLAVGTGVVGLDGRGGGRRELYLSLDLDTDKLPGNGTFLSVAKHAFNYFHIPAPTVRLAPDVTFYGLRF